MTEDITHALYRLMTDLATATSGSEFARVCGDDRHNEETGSEVAMVDTGPVERVVIEPWIHPGIGSASLVLRNLDHLAPETLIDALDLRQSATLPHGTRVHRKDFPYGEVDIRLIVLSAASELLGVELQRVPRPPGEPSQRSSDVAPPSGLGSAVVRPDDPGPRP